MEQQWIKCSDRLPEFGVFVLCWMTDPLRKKKVMQCCRYSELGFWQDLAWIDLEVTHWQNLPEPPTE